MLAPMFAPATSNVGQQTAADNCEDRTDRSLTKVDTVWSPFEKFFGNGDAAAHPRRELSQLTYAQVQDIGLTRAEARWETKKPFWRV
jgi:hypothetical protein